jgi:hypothetical protein
MKSSEKEREDGMLSLSTLPVWQIVVAELLARDVSCGGPDYVVISLHCGKCVQAMMMMFVRGGGRCGE